MDGSRAGARNRRGRTGRAARPALPVADAVAVVPAYNEAHNIARTVGALRRVPELDEVVVVDGFSTDGTARAAERAGARVIEQRERVYPGKGIALETAIAATDQEGLLFFDADLRNVDPTMPRRLLLPLLRGEADHVIGHYRRKAGRVTELTVRPLLRLFFPEVHFRQPLAGEYAFRRDLIESLRLEPGWGLESGLVIDVVMRGARSLEVDLGFKDHDMKELAELRTMASQAAATVLRKAAEYGRLDRARRLPGGLHGATPHGTLPV